MNTIAIDTYKTINNLKSKGFTTEQAEGIIEALVESDLVTNSYFRSELQKELANTRADIFKGMAAMLVAQAAAIVALQTLVQ